MTAAEATGAPHTDPAINVVRLLRIAQFGDQLRRPSRDARNGMSDDNHYESRLDCCIEPKAWPPWLKAASRALQAS